MTAATLAAQQMLGGGPSVLYDAVAVVTSDEGATTLAGMPAAKDFVTDAHNHKKFIGARPRVRTVVRRGRSRRQHRRWVLRPVGPRRREAVRGSVPRRSAVGPPLARPTPADLRCREVSELVPGWRAPSVRAALSAGASRPTGRRRDRRRLAHGRPRRALAPWTGRPHRHGRGERHGDARRHRRQRGATPHRGGLRRRRQCAAVGADRLPARAGVLDPPGRRPR